MKSVVICLMSFMLPFFAAGQGNYGFGFVVAHVSHRQDSTSKLIFVTDVVDLDSLAGRKKSSSNKFSKRKLGEYRRAMENWVLGMIELERSGVAVISHLEINNQIELYPDLSLQSDQIKKLNKRLGVKLDRAFMMKIKAVRRREIMLDAISHEPGAEVTLLRNLS